MNCNFSWYNLPAQIKKELNLNVKWYNLPSQLDDILEGLSIIKPDCYNAIYPKGSPKFLWYNLPSQINKLCQLVQCQES